MNLNDFKDMFEESSNSHLNFEPQDFLKEKNLLELGFGEEQDPDLEKAI